MEDLIILGTGIHGGEMVEIIDRINAQKPTWNLLGFITSEEKRVGEEFNGLPILGTKEILHKYPKAALVPEYEWPYKREIPMERCVSVIDPSSFVSRTAEVGKGTVIFPNCYVGMNAKIGNMVFCLSGAIINHDDILEDYVTITSGVTLAGSVRVEESTYVGQSATIRQLLTIGRESMIGMGSVVVKDVPPSSLMMGNPARRIREYKK